MATGRGRREGIDAYAERSAWTEADRREGTVSGGWNWNRPPITRDLGNEPRVVLRATVVVECDEKRGDVYVLRHAHAAGGRRQDDGANDRAALDPVPVDEAQRWARGDGPRARTGENLQARVADERAALLADVEQEDLTEDVAGAGTE